MAVYAVVRNNNGDLDIHYIKGLKAIDRYKDYIHKVIEQLTRDLHDKNLKDGFKPAQLLELWENPWKKSEEDLRKEVLAQCDYYNEHKDDFIYDFNHPEKGIRYYGA